MADSWSFISPTAATLRSIIARAAPAATTRDVFLGADGKPDPRKSRFTGLGIGVPGTVAGLSLALEKYGSGKFTLSDLLAPTIKLAREGIPVEDDVADTFDIAQRLMGRWAVVKEDLLSSR